MKGNERARAASGEELLEMGVVGRAFGLRGQVRLRPHNPGGDTLEKAGRIFLEDDSGGTGSYEITGIKPHQGVFVASLEGVMTREDAEALRGRKIYVRMSDLPELEDDEFYWFELVGLEVWCSGRLLGRVSGIQETAPELDGSDIIVVDSGDGEVLIPTVSEIVREVDIDSGKMELEPGRGYDPQV